MKMTYKLPLLLCLLVSVSACGTTPKKSGNATHKMVEGLEKCPLPLGTVSIFEDRELPWWSDYRSRAPDLGSTVPVIRMMVQHSNCFVVVERGAAMRAMRDERRLMQEGEVREGSNFGKGQMVASDYTISPSVQFAGKTGGFGGLVGGLLGDTAAALVGKFDKNEAETTLLLIDNRSGVQLGSAIGSAKNYDLTGGIGALFKGGNVGGLGGYSRTPEGKIIVAAFADSYNQMVEILRNYKTQEVEGGLGKGGRLGVGK